MNESKKQKGCLFFLTAIQSRLRNNFFFILHNLLFVRGSFSTFFTFHFTFTFSDILGFSNHLRTCFDMLRHVQICFLSRIYFLSFSTFFHILFHIFFLGYIRPFWDMFRHVRTCLDILGHFQTCYDMFRHFLVV